MNFRQTIDSHFPNALPEADFVKRVYTILSHYGFKAKNSLACVGVCRDEITASLVNTIEQVWGPTFNFSSLGGMLFLGKTGFSAAHAHAPIEAGRERYVYFALPHIAINQAGKIGVCSRPGRPKDSGACGALLAFQQEWAEGNLNLQLDFDDIEQSLLKQRLADNLEKGEYLDLVTLTKIVSQVILADLEHLIEITVSPAVSDYAILNGIQIHGPDNSQYVWPGTMYAVKHGQRIKLSIEASQT